MLKSDKGLEHLDEALQHLLRRLGIGQRRYPAQQGLGFMPVFGLALTTTHQIDQSGLQFVAQGFQFAVANHLVACSAQRVRKITLDTIRLP